MNVAQYLSVCLASLKIHLRSRLSPAHAGKKRRNGVPVIFLFRTGMLIAGIALCFTNRSIAQDASSASDSQGAAGRGENSMAVAQSSPAAVNPNSIMGFEVPTAWSLRIDGFFPDFNVKSTTDRTQGNAAFAVANAPNLMTLTSQPIASTATALTGIGNQGALLQLDVLLPAASNGPNRNGREFCDPANEGWIDAFVSVPSRRLYLEPLGHVLLNKYRTGIYNTIGFSVPNRVSSALNGVSFNDMVFAFVITSPNRVTGTYLFDNLRIHSVELTQTPTGQAPPPGYGGSVNLVVPGNAPVTQSYAIDPTQIPEGFHLKTGTAGTTTVQLQLGLDSTPSLTCTYGPDSTDTTHESYIFKSCTGAYEPGDLVSANWVSLGIEGGTVAQLIHAQIALNPLGNLTGSGLIPPMPTFWGDADTCAPAPVAGQVVTNSASCTAQTAKANAIITAYFNQVNEAKPSPNWVVAPVPESATRSGDGTPVNFLTDTPISSSAAKSKTTAVTPADTPANDSPFSTGGDLNPGGSFDAYWQLSGNLIPTAVAGTDDNTTHFDATFTAHGVLFGDDIDVADAKLTADTDSGETTPTYKAATSTGTLGFYVFGEEIPSGGLTFSPSTGFSIDPSWSQEYDLPPIQIWIFSITLGALVDADLNAQGSAALSGADLSVIPTASIGGHISGGINLGIADGNVDAKINLITLSVPTTAQVKWVINTSPDLCAFEMTGAINSNLTLGSGGGEVDLDASFGPCPFCYTDSWTLFKWGPLVSKSWTLFNDVLDTQFFGLPSSLCAYPVTVSITSPTSGASLSSGLPITLTGVAAPTDNTLPYTAKYNWTFTPGANASTATVNPSGANGPNPVVTFGAPTSGSTSTWTVNLTATTSVNGNAGTTTTETGTATPVTITVTNLSAGVYIAGVSSATNGVAIPNPDGSLNLGNVPGLITFTGVVSGATGALNTTFSIVQCNDYTAACTNPGSPTTLTTTGATTTTPSATWNGFEGGYYKVTMTTTAGGSAFGTASAVVEGTVLF
jgi:hypothetical protein